MSDINTTILNELVKDLGECLDILRDHTKTEPARVVVLSHIQGTLLTISSEAMALVADTAKLIGAAGGTSSATDDLLKDIINSVNDKGKESN
jgi:hypothetical protein